VKWISLPVFHHSSPTISIAETVYKMHVGVFFVCKRVRLLTTTILQQNTATLAKTVYKQELSQVNSIASPFCGPAVYLIYFVYSL
jgi:hypothetical protein